MTIERKKVPATTRVTRAQARRMKAEGHTKAESCTKADSRTKAEGHAKAAGRAKAKKIQSSQKMYDDRWTTLNPHKEPAMMKHKTTFELVENPEKKKKLEIEYSTDHNPPPGFEFLPLGYPALSKLCKEISREQGAMMFIVSSLQNKEAQLHELNRIGYHFRQTIFEEARDRFAANGTHFDIHRPKKPGEPEPIPRTQKEVDAQADAVLRDLFNRIPNIDRREIVDHSFRIGGHYRGEKTVGQADDITLARRVQLATLAHIRHRHTRYDKLLKESRWANARKAVLDLCRDIIFKWRGDEETGRDQLSEILCEVIELSDSSGSEDESFAAEPTPALASRASAMPIKQMVPADQRSPPQTRGRDTSVSVGPISSKKKDLSKAEKSNAPARRFRRYALVAQAIADSTDERDRDISSNVARSTPILAPAPAPLSNVPIELTRSPGSIQVLNCSREPAVAMRSTQTIEPIPRHLEMRPDLQRLDDGPRRERVSVIPHDRPEVNAQASPERVYNPEHYRPKVGRMPANHDHPQSTHSTVRHGLQDMLLQSIEPASPVAPLRPYEVPHTSYDRLQFTIDTHRTVSHVIHEAAEPAPLPGSSAAMSDSNEIMADRYRRVDYHPGYIISRSGRSLIRINHDDRSEEHRRVPTDYLPDKRAPTRLGPEDLPRNSQVSGEGVARYGGVPTGTSANPIIMDDDLHYEPRHVVEMRRYPAGDHHVTPSRLAEVDPHPPMGRDIRIKNDPQVVYFDTPHARPRSAFDYRGSAHLPSQRFNPYQKPDNHRAPTTAPRHTIDAPVDYESGYDKEPMRSQRQFLERVRSPINVSREVRAGLPGQNRPEMHYAGASHRHSEFSGPDRRDVQYYIMREHREAPHQQTEYRPKPEFSYLSPPPPYVAEHHESPLLQHAPNPYKVYYEP